MNVGNRKSDVIPNRNAVEMNGGGWNAVLMYST